MQTLNNNDSKKEWRQNIYVVILGSLPHLCCPCLHSGNRCGYVCNGHGQVLDRGWCLRRTHVYFDHGGDVGRYQEASAAEGMGALHLGDGGYLCVHGVMVYGNPIMWLKGMVRHGAKVRTGYKKGDILTTEGVSWICIMKVGVKSPCTTDLIRAGGGRESAYVLHSLIQRHRRELRHVEAHVLLHGAGLARSLSNHAWWKHQQNKCHVD